MSGIWLIARRDFSAFINTMWGWLILSLALLIDGILFNAFALSSTPRLSAEVLTDFFFLTGGIVLFAGVAITMRLFAEERQTGTIVLLESSPLSETQAVIGKYLSGLMFLALFLVLTAVSFSLFGFIIGICADGFEKVQIVPMLVITPLSFLGGSFYSLSMLPPFWQKVALFNPVVYLISGFRWSFYGVSDVSVALSAGMAGAFLAVCMAAIWWIFKTGYRLRA